MEKLIIIGAGITGLYAATLLAGKYDVTLVEAANKPGGRIRQVIVHGHAVEAGAEFIHGELPVTSKLLAAAGINVIPSNPTIYRKNKHVFTEEEEMIDGWDLLLEKMKTGPDMTLIQLLDLHFSHPSYDQLRKQAISFAEGFDVADINKVSVCSLHKEWSEEQGQYYRPESGYIGLVDHLAKEATQKGCQLLLNKKVRQVIHNDVGCNIITEHDERYQANKVLITISPALLRDSDCIAFTPPLQHQAAAADIGFGGVLKFHFLFKAPFWQQDAGMILSEEAIPTWWVSDPSIPLLTGWLGGPAASTASFTTKEELINTGLQSLANIFRLSNEKLRSDLVTAEVHDWCADDLIRGGYSYHTLHTTAAIDLLMEGYENRILFAGEAIYKGAHPGTVEAALSSAEIVSNKMLAAIT